MSDRTLRQTVRITRHIIDVGKEPIRQHVRFGSSFLHIMLPIALDDPLDMRQAFGNQTLVHPQEPRQRDSEVQVVVKPDHVATSLDLSGVYESHVETAANLETLPDEVTTGYYS